MMLSIFVAASDNDVIGKKGSLPWRLPAEMAYFKQTTMGHPIIMGRKTHESIGRALPGRYNVVITHQKNYQSEGCAVVGSLDEALNLDKVKSSDEVFVIGGESVYEKVLPIAQKLYLTKVHATIAGDIFFRYDPSQWQVIWSEKHAADDKNKYDFEFTQQIRKA